MVVNATYALAPWADVCYAADHSFWRVYAPDILSRFKGELWTVSEGARDEFGLYWMRCGKNAGFSREPDTINGGGNSGYQSVHLAATFGAKRIVLLGFDMQRTGGKEHWHGKHKGRLRNGTGFANWMKQMAFLARDLRRLGVDVINCTRTTAMTCFVRRNLEEVLDEIALKKRGQGGQGTGGLEITEPESPVELQTGLAVDEVQRQRRLPEMELPGFAEPGRRVDARVKKARRRTSRRKPRAVSKAPR